ncbi:30S ribosomal protein S17 [Candidatus Woesearchaeota archaeon]|nr:30S ribosomal protein S17 [Candidatus Woesearchaeota archaeon]
MAEVKNIGFGIPSPEKGCENDSKCPFHGDITVRGKILTGKVLSAKTAKNVTVEIASRKYISKYERYVPVRTKIKAHNPDCLKAKEGDVVKIAETRPLSKTKSFVVVQIVSGVQDASN